MLMLGARGPCTIIRGQNCNSTQEIYEDPYEGNNCGQHCGQQLLLSRKREPGCVGVRREHRAQHCMEACRIFDVDWTAYKSVRTDR
jgi:hypothetical protein